MISFPQSQFFKFEDTFNSENISITEFKGWNGLLVMRIKNLENLKNKNTVIKSKFFDINKNEKLIIATKGEVNITVDNRDYLLKEFDSLNIFNEKKLSIDFKKVSELYLVTAENLISQSKKPFLFNFKKDISPKDIWGGECISRVYFGDQLNIVMFDLKPGFKFHDDGHTNEQITWIVNGEIDFYVDNIKKKLKNNLGVDIGKNIPHGGISNGAIGFDAFFPKRQENKYHNK